MRIIDRTRRSRRLKSVTALGLVAMLFLIEGTASQAAKSVSQIKEEQEELQSEIDDLDAELVGILTEIDTLETQISSTQAEIDETNQNIIDAQAQVDTQYESMKIRIKYMYENNDQDVFTILLESGSITDFLNRLEYVNQVYSYDRQVLENYEAAQAALEDLKAGLDSEMADLQTAQNELATQKASLNSMIASKQTQMEDFETQLEKARQLAAQQAAQQAANNTSASTGSSSSGNVNGNLNPSPSTGVSGSAVVSYANQFVGGRYVWGGNSLTNGVDCSGFVQQVYANFGITWGGRMTSGSFRSVGQEVSYNNMQPGDIVCYSGHVAIYAGGGKIVEAQSTAAGITNYRAANCKTIITIRRVI